MLDLLRWSDNSDGRCFNFSTMHTLAVRTTYRATYQATHWSADKAADYATFGTADYATNNAANWAAIYAADWPAERPTYGAANKSADCATISATH